MNNTFQHCELMIIKHGLKFCKLY